jgi:hypothetical protein
MSVEIELFGGPADGRRASIPEHLLRQGLEVRVAPAMTLENYGLVGGHLLSPAARPLRYEWDGTITPAGEHRFRLTGSR